MQHFFLTRFNLLLWNKDKEGERVRTIKWLEHRFSLFEKFCLPSIAKQTCKDFKWIVLFDSSTPENYKEKIGNYQKAFPQLIPVFVKPEAGRYFAKIFKDEVGKRLGSNHNDSSTGSPRERVLTTYLDNDDALNIRFVEDIQRRAVALPDGTFITYDNGYQLFTDRNYVMSICYPRNHFVSVIEGADNAAKTIYGYGSHYYIDKIKDVRIEHVRNQPMWCEVIHEKNMGNDAYFLLNTRMIRDRNLLRKEFAIEEDVMSSFCLYAFRFLPRYCKTFIRRTGYFLFGRHW